jgi:hypothetical protein
VRPRSARASQTLERIMASWVRNPGGRGITEVGRRSDFFPFGAPEEQLGNLARAPPGPMQGARRAHPPRGL